ncbi:hypothetical protein BDN72DRAFT_831972 [Pluteus cervinus]|uniref:Uncharacterized protein n=1 Tax=Pluteus cervinus TaxID=181527 RepID=A0ACD3BC97_9AGAR|nr:hypothetical protein BDN72DRAFT_831972 [Pluteus cervinus]
MSSTSTGNQSISPELTTSCDASFTHLTAPDMEKPPSYEEARIPRKPITYQFSTLPNGACILLPPSDAADSRPVYHVRTFQSVFSPLARTTVIRRGGGDEGELVGEFEFGMSSNKPYISIHGEFIELTYALYKSGKAPGHISHVVPGHWTWARPPVRMYWDCTKRSTWTCTISGGSTITGGKTLLAKYTPPDITPRGHLMPTLQVTPTGQQYFDRIFITAILLEQKATFPAFGGPMEYKEHFNF